MRLLLLGVLMIWLNSAHSQLSKPGSYIALIPHECRLGSVYTIYFKLLRPVAYQTVTANIIYQNLTVDGKSKNHTIASGSLSLPSGTLEGMLELNVEDTYFENDYYRTYLLTMNGSGSVTFSFYSHIYCSSPREFSSSRNNNGHIFIQTDKAVYKTGQQVRYRVFLVDREMKPMEGAFDVKIYDPKDNTIKVEKGVKNLFGTSGDLQLSDQPVLGRWKIKATNKENNETETLYFEVKNYVLPLFEVNVDLPPFGTVDNPQLKGKVTAKYTYGKPVKGRVTLSVSKSSRYWWFYEPKAIQTEFEIDGEADFNIATDTLLKFDPNLKYDTLRVTAEVKEEETGETRTGESQIEYHERPIKLEFHNTDKGVFKPGFTYTTYIKVTQPDGRPLSSVGDRLQVAITYLSDKKSSAASTFRVPQHPSSNLMKFVSPFAGGDVIFMPNMFLPIPQDGMIKLDLDIPDNVATGHIDVKLNDVKISKNIERFHTVSKAYLQLEMKSAFVQVGKQAEFSIRSNVRPNGKITYHIINDCRILETHFTYISSPYQKNVFYVKMTPEMIPHSQILAYYFDEEHGEIIADAISYEVQTTFKNDVSLRFDRSQVEPGSNVTLNIRADPDSQVYILAVDKSVLLQKSGNDITKKKVYRRLGVSDKPEWKYRNSFLYKRLQANSPMRVFSQTCMTATTDALLHDFSLWSLTPDQHEIHFHDAKSSSWSMGAGGYGNYIGEVRQTRDDFPETWIWSNASIGPSGNAAMTVTVPDTITDWVATGYALNRNSGLGIATESANLTAYLPFFVNLHFPTSIVKNEIAVIQALVFNYYSHDLYVTVTLKNSSKEFVSIEIDRYGNEMENGDILQKCILVKANDVESAYLPVMPLKTGTIDIEVEASSSRGKDSIKRQLIVKPPGIEEEGNHPVILTADHPRVDEVVMPIVYPIRVVPGSQRIQVTVTGDIFGPSMNNLDQLIKMPYGCGEQNMVRFAPAVYAAQYLTTVNKKLDDKLDRKIQQSLETGYQRELTYLRHDGSFSAFGQRDKEGSIWLTAFVLKTFAQASEFTYIEPAIVNKSAYYILGQQNADGSYNNTGFVHNKAMQGASTGSSVSLVAYIVTALNEVQSKDILENSTKADILSSITMAMNFLEENKSKLTSDYDLAITAYASTLISNNSLTDVMMKRLESSPRFVTTGTMKHWQHQSRSTEVEIAAYALMVYANKQDDIKGYPVMEWLVDRRTSYGGYVSTQDTVVALQALSAVATQTYNADINMKIVVDHGGEKNNTVNINADNMDVLQYIDVPEEATSLTITASGNGTGLVEVSTFYNVLNDENHPSLDLDVTINATSVDRYNLTACARWLDTDDSGMVLLEIGFPSGYKLAPEHFPDENKIRPSRTENNNGKTVLYYSKLGKEPTCYTVGAVRDSIVGNTQDAAVRVYSYYNPEIMTQKFYTLDVPNKSVCEFCGVKCGCGYNPEVVPDTHCPGILSNYHRGVNTAHNMVVVPAQPQDNADPYKRVIQTVESPDTEIVYRQRLQPNRWHRGKPLPVSLGSHTVKRTYPTIHKTGQVTVNRHRTVHYPDASMNGPVSVSRRTVKHTYPTLPNSMPVVHRRWTVNRG